MLLKVFYLVSTSSKVKDYDDYIKLYKLNTCMAMQKINGWLFSYLRSFYLSLINQFQVEDLLLLDGHDSHATLEAIE
jgi:hypothetical protein